MTDLQTRRPQYDEPLPDRMRGLPREHRGYVVPYFVAWLADDGREVNIGAGTPDFRIISTHRMKRCIRERLCWCCGQKMGRYLAFTIGPMCAITRTTLEPPAHLECVHYAVKVCPFMLRPRMVRNEKDMPEGHWAPGLTITRNPGVMAVWVTRSYERFHVDAQHGGTAGDLIRVGDPERVEWWSQGRHATREEVQASIDSGLPILREQADREGPIARRELEERFIPTINRLLPVAS